MKTLTITTQSYGQALQALAADGDGMTVRYAGQHEGLYYMRVIFDGTQPAETLTGLLEYVAVQENPVYRHSEKLTSLALTLRHTPIHADNLSRLTQYIKENRRLHLEGYVVFRMAEYRHKLDMMMFSLIKNMKLT